ncbi:unnamed protein product [Ostreobium quekettii]|uniref:Tetratricopeptide repeat protein n=1 Tax=Ostreobium quekettii TaxID=121088 RepID=A0A8S1IU48_9CHLO|nr:unnamed protein product [Ostreobium quekettii]
MLARRFATLSDTFANTPMTVAIISSVSDIATSISTRVKPSPPRRRNWRQRFGAGTKLQCGRLPRGRTAKDPTARGPRLRRNAACGLLCLLLVDAASAQPPDKPSAEAARAYASAAALQDRGLHDLAAKEWQTLLKTFPQDALAPRAEYNLGVCRFQQGDFANAAETFQQAARHAQDDSVAEASWSNLGLARFNEAASQADARPQQAAAAYKSAIAAFDQLIAKFPNSTQAGGAQFYRGESLTALGRFDEAAASYRNALADATASPLHTAARLGLASAELELGQPEQAEATLNTLIAGGAVGQSGGEAHTLRGEARLAAGQPASAAEDFAQAASVEGYAAADHAQERRAFALYSAGDHAAAADAYQELARRFPESPLTRGATLAAGKCLLLAGKHDDAAFLLAAEWRADPTAANAESAH